MGFLKKLFSGKKMNKYAFPSESNRGRIELSQGRIVWEGTNYYDPSGDIEIGKIDRIYAVVDRDKESSLGLCNKDSSRCIPVCYNGFRSVYEILSSRFGLDDMLFLQTIHTKKYAKKLLWKKSFQPNYHIIEDNLQDYGKGFEIQSPQKEFITWDILFCELRENKNTSFLFDKNTNALRFNYPVRVGRLLFHNLTAHNYKRDDIAVRFFLANCHTHDATDWSYDDVYTCLFTDLGADKMLYHRVDEDGKVVDFSIKDISFSAEYRYDNEYNFEDGYTSIRITNDREYPALLVNKPYEDVMEVSDYLLLRNDISLDVDYKYNSYPKRRPPLLDKLFGNENIIWRDDANRKIGFADPRFSIVLDIDIVKSFAIENLVPAKGKGGADLIANLTNKSITGFETMYTFKGKYRCLNEYADRLQSLTRKETFFPPEFSDC